MLVYHPPSLGALKCRRAFYSNAKLSTESTMEWFERIASSINGCEFNDFADIMLVDKFLSGVDESTYHHVLKEIGMDSHQALLIALTNESEHAGDSGSKNEVSVKMESDDEERVHIFEVVRARTEYSCRLFVSELQFELV